MKKRLSILLIVFLIFSQIPRPVAAANSHDPVAGTVKIHSSWTGPLQGVIEGFGISATDVRQLYITATGTMDSVDIAYLNTMKNLERLDVADTVTIEDAGAAFLSELKQVTYVNFPAESFGVSAFRACQSLRSVRLPKATTLGHLAFYHCHQLENVNLPKVTTFGEWTFEYCQQPITLILGSTKPAADNDTFRNLRGDVIVPLDAHASYDSNQDGT